MKMKYATRCNEERNYEKQKRNEKSWLDKELTKYCDIETPEVLGHDVYLLKTN